MAKRVDGNQGEIISALRQAGCSVTDTHELGHGFPDVVAGRAGVNYLIEIKRTAHSPLTPDEVTWHGTWLGYAVILHSPEQALAAIGLHAAPIGRFARNTAQTRR